jgi:hypothetical protein
MPYLAPTVFTPLGTPFISVTMSGNLTYQQFKESLGSYVYEVEKIYIQSANQTQIKGNFEFSKYDSDGRQNAQSILSVIDPFQFQNALYIKTQNKGVVLDGRDSVQFNMQPNTTLQIKLYAKRITSGDNLNQLTPSNFQQLEEAEGYLGYFEEYKDSI